MDATYERILSTIDAKPRPQRDLARRALIWIAYAREPLLVDDLACAISIEIHTTSLEDLESSIPTKESILDACANLVSIDQHSAHIRFVHFSVQEFLTSHRSTTLCMGHEVAHREIAQACIILYTLSTSQSSFLASLHQYAFKQWPHHLLAGNLNSLQIDDPVVILTLSFFEKGPVLYIKQQSEQPIQGSDIWAFRIKITNLKFSPFVLALIFDLPGTQQGMQLSRKQLEDEWPKAVYNDNLNCVVLSDDELAIHYATAELDSVPAARRLCDHGYVLDYAYYDPDGIQSQVQDWLQVSPLYSVQSMQMARYLLNNGISIEPQRLRHDSSDPLKYFARKDDWGLEVFQLLSDRAEGGRLTDALQSAAYHNHIKIFRLLLDKGANINTQGGEYGHALQAAAYGGNVETTRLLLERGANVNAHGGKYGNALQAATASFKYHKKLRDPIAVVRLLLDKGAKVNAEGGIYGSALQAAAAKFAGLRRHNTKIEMLRLLLDQGADVNAQGGRYGNALQAAAAEAAPWDADKDGVIRLLLDNGADINAQGGKYGNALQAAAASYRNNVKVFQLLLDNGADINAHGGLYGNALQATAYSGKSEVIRLLLGNGADINAQGGRYGNALQAAAASYRDNLESIRLLLDNGADINAQGGQYGNALQAAAASRTDKVEVIRLLLDNGADTNAQGGQYGNALQAAAALSKLEVIRLLLDNGANVNAQGGQYGNVLQATAYTGKSEIIRLLLDQGADINVQGGLYGNALQSAVFKRRVDIVQLLLNKGADVNIQGGMFGTVLQAAAYNGNIKVIQFLLDKGADIHVRSGKYGAALGKVLALAPAAGQKVPGDISLLRELLQDHSTTLLKGSYSDERIKREFFNENRCNLNVFREILESRGWKRTQDGQERGPDKLEEEESEKNEIEDEIKNEHGSSLVATVHVWKLFGLTFLVFLIYAFIEFWGV